MTKTRIAFATFALALAGCPGSQLQSVVTDGGADGGPTATSPDASVCPAGATACPGDGGDVSVDLSSDPNHCGQCNEYCPRGQPCAEGQCGSCPQGESVVGSACAPPPSPDGGVVGPPPTTQAPDGGLIWGTCPTVIPDGQPCTGGPQGNWTCDAFSECFQGACIPIDSVACH